MFGDRGGMMRVVVWSALTILGVKLINSRSNAPPPCIGFNNKCLKINRRGILINDTQLSPTIVM